MQKSATFRCPYDERAQAEEKLIEVRLGEDITERLVHMLSAFTRFASDEDTMAIKFTLPPSVLQKCKTIHDLRFAILPYQTEVTAAHIDHRLRPLLAYHLKLKSEWAQKAVNDAAKSNDERLQAALALNDILMKQHAAPKSVLGLAQWLHGFFRVGMAKGFESPTEDLTIEVQGKTYKVGVFQAWSFLLVIEGDPLSRKDNRNCLSIVKTPFYPQEFGRYSEEVEIYVTRDADFRAVAPETHKMIRVRANTIHRAHGVRVEDLEKDQQPLGLWIPKYA